jgi:2-polyprenyl-3-methyl-5-hydroxy-6-metoxy-1,4-benzoquinol methylase
MTETPSSAETDRWQREREFFDRHAETAGDIKPVPPETLHRYGQLKRPFFSPEYRYRVAGDLRGKHVLDVGCGEGLNTVVLAKLGAFVTGIDISQGAIDAATERARINGISDRVRFECAPLELARLEPGSFDIIWGEAILHHLLSDLDGMLGRIVSWAKPDGTILFAEPVVLSRTLRRIRLMLPLHTDATPDERPLETSELAVVSRHLRDAEFRYFDFLGRLDRFIIPTLNFEKSSAVRRAVSSLFRVIDYGLLSMPGVQRLAGSCVIHGRPARPAASAA